MTKYNQQILQEAHFKKVFNETLNAVLPDAKSELKYTYDTNKNMLLYATVKHETRVSIDLLKFYNLKTWYLSGITK